MNLCTSVAVKGQSIGLVTAIVDGESQLSKSDESHSLTDCSERYTSWLLTPTEKGWEMCCNRATSLC